MIISGLKPDLLVLPRTQSPDSDCFKIILVTFNGGKPLNNIAFVPGNCEVINLENEEQFFRVWDSGFEEPSAGMCQDNLNPLGFTVLQEPTESKAFYGLTYRGKILMFGIRAGRTLSSCPSPCPFSNGNFIKNV